MSFIILLIYKIRADLTPLSYSKPLNSVPNIWSAKRCWFGTLWLVSNHITHIYMLLDHNKNCMLQLLKGQCEIVMSICHLERKEFYSYFYILKTPKYTMRKSKSAAFLQWMTLLPQIRTLTQSLGVRVCIDGVWINPGLIVNLWFIISSLK